MLNSEQKHIRDEIVTDVLKRLKDEVNEPTGTKYASKLNELVEVVDKLSQIS